jgi:myosin-18
LTKEKEWIESGRVWLQHRDGFTSARLHLEPIGEELIEEGRVRLKLDGTGEVVSVDEDEVVKANPPQFDLAEDLAQLRHLNEASLLHTLRCRYAASLPHTYAGQSLVVINPVTPLAVYSERVQLTSPYFKYFNGIHSFQFVVLFEYSDDPAVPRM